MTDVPVAHRHKPERGRLTTRGRSTDDGSSTTLIVVHETDGAWTIPGLGAPGVTLSEADMVALGAGIVALAAQVWPRTATIVVAVSYLLVCWALGRGLAR